MQSALGMPIRVGAHHVEHAAAFDSCWQRIRLLLLLLDLPRARPERQQVAA